MPNIRQYRYFHKENNEWLADVTNGDDKEWQEAWELLLKECSHKIEFTEEMYMNSEYGDTPEWVNITINDSGVLPFKMARGIIGALDGAKGVVFHSHFEVDMSTDWGGWSYCRLEVAQGSAYITICSKHSSEELELNITEQFNQAIGETA